MIFFSGDGEIHDGERTGLSVDGEAGSVDAACDADGLGLGFGDNLFAQEDFLNGGGDRIAFDGEVDFSEETARDVEDTVGGIDHGRAGGEGLGIDLEHMVSGIDGLDMVFAGLVGFGVVSVVEIDADATDARVIGVLPAVAVFVAEDFSKHSTLVKDRIVGDLDDGAGLFADGSARFVLDGGDVDVRADRKAATDSDLVTQRDVGESGQIEGSKAHQAGGRDGLAVFAVGVGFCEDFAAIGAFDARAEGKQVKARREDIVDVDPAGFFVGVKEQVDGAAVFDFEGVGDDIADGGDFEGGGFAEDDQAIEGVEGEVVVLDDLWAVGDGESDIIGLGLVGISGVGSILGDDLSKIGEGGELCDACFGSDACGREDQGGDGGTDGDAVASFV